MSRWNYWLLAKVHRDEIDYEYLVHKQGEGAYLAHLVISMSIFAYQVVITIES